MDRAGRQVGAENVATAATQMYLAVAVFCAFPPPMCATQPPFQPAGRSWRACWIEEKVNFWFHIYNTLLNQAPKLMAGGPAHPESMPHGDVDADARSKSKSRSGARGFEGM